MEVGRLELALAATVDGGKLIEGSAIGRFSTYGSETFGFLMRVKGKETEAI